MADSTIDTPPSSILVYAGFGERVLAFILDCCVCTALLLFMMMVPMMVLGPSPHYADAFDDDGFACLFYAFLFGVMWLYSAIMESSSKQGTVGKLSVGIRVTTLDGHRISFKTASIRFVMKCISCLMLGAGFLFALFGKRKQTLHDRVAKTVVIAGTTAVIAPVHQPQPL